MRASGSAVGLLALSAALTVGAPAVAQRAPSEAAVLRVYLECAGCDMARLRREVGYIEWLSEPAGADLHVRVEPADTAVELWLSGSQHFAGVADTLRFPADAAVPDAWQSELVRTVQIELLRYAAAVALDRDLHIAFLRADTGVAAAAQVQRVAQRPAPDRRAPASAGAGPGARQGAGAAERRWAVSVDLGFTGSSGNSDLIALSTGIRVRHLQTKLFRLDWSAGFRYGESGGEVAARHMQSKLEFDMGPDARVAPFISAAGERDPFRRLELRGKTGSGIRYSFYKRDSGEASLRAAALYSHERFTPEADRDPRSDGTWSFKLNASQRFGEGIRIENASSYDPVVDDFGDYNLEVTSKFSTRITRRVALTFSHAYSYDSTPVRDVGRVDQRFQTGLTMEF